MFVGSAGYWAVGSPLSRAVEWAYRVSGLTGPGISGSPMRIVRIADDEIRLNFAVGMGVSLRRHHGPSRHDESPDGSGFF
jgi:hypothetical protein